jgi:hypothetical protein
VTSMAHSASGMGQVWYRVTGSTGVANRQVAYRVGNGDVDARRVRFVGAGATAHLTGFRPGCRTRLPIPQRRLPAHLDPGRNTPAHVGAPGGLRSHRSGHAADQAGTPDATLIPKHARHRSGDAFVCVGAQSERT